MENHKFNALYSSELFYNLFFEGERKATLLEYLNDSFFDSSGYIDLNNDTLKVVYQVKNKYVNPPYQAHFSAAFEFILENIIHPDDRELYKTYLSPQNALNALKTSKHPGFLYFHHRVKLQDGTYRWAEQALITGKDYGLEEGVIRFFIYDIQNVKSREAGQISDDRISLNKGKDDVTSLYVRETFFDKSLEFIKDKTGLCLISIDIEHFMLFDEWYGRETGNYLLSKIGSILLDYVHTNEGIAGYFGQDDFALITSFNRTKIKKLYSDIKKCISAYGFSTGFVPAFGICQLLDSSDLQDAYDKATIASEDAKANIQKRIQIYDASKHLQDEQEYHLLLEFMQALKEEEITFYLQPQCRISTGKIVGAEALARWVKPNQGIVPPIKFIPVLEKYGFVVDLDQYIWDKVCKFIKDCLDNNIPLVPISINVSQVDIFSIDVADHLSKLMEKYQIPCQYFKVEITESAYAETSTVVVELVNKLREMGFMVLMDDFGSGYSSLNMLSDLDVDVIKLDAMFLDTQKVDYKKGIHILESVVNMTKTIALPIIVEGVETEQQKSYLEELGCRYAQGFYFYRPIPQSEFISLISKDDIIDPRGFVVKTNDQFRIREFLDENIYSDAMLNNILGPVAIYAWKDEQVDIVRFNEQFYETVDVPDFHSRLTNIQRFLPKEDVPVIYKLLKESMENKLNGSTGILHFYKTDGTLTNYIMRYYYLGEQSGFHKFYGMANNTTALTDLQEQMSLISRFSSETIIFLSHKNDIWHFNVAVHGLEKVIGLDKVQLENELNDWSFFKRMEGVDEDRIRRLALDYLGKDMGFNYDFKLKNDDGSIITLNLKADPVKGEANNVEYILTYRVK